MSDKSRGRAIWLLGGVVAGTALGWLTARRRGNWVRNQLEQKLLHWRRIGRRRMYKSRRDLGNRIRGGATELRELALRRFWHAPRYVDANTLVDQVHSQLGRAFAPTFEHVNLNGAGHTIYLHGHVRDEAERDRLVEAIEGIAGVEAVRSESLRVGAVRVGAPGGVTEPRQRTG